jgi:hypothetical protein
MLLYLLNLNIILAWGLLLIFNIVDSREELKLDAWDRGERIYLRVSSFVSFCGLVPTVLWLSHAARHEIESPWDRRTCLSLIITYGLRVFGPSSRGVQQHREASIQFALITLLPIAHLIWRHIHP